MGLSSSLFNVFIPLTFPYGFDRARSQYATYIVEVPVREIEQPTTIALISHSQVSSFGLSLFLEIDFLRILIT